MTHTRWAVLLVVSGLSTLAVGRGIGYGIGYVVTAIAILGWLHTWPGPARPVTHDRGGHVHVLEDGDAE